MAKVAEGKHASKPASRLRATGYITGPATAAVRLKAPIHIFSFKHSFINGRAVVVQDPATRQTQLMTMLWNGDQIKRSPGELRPRPARLLSAVTFGGLVITGLCMSLLYLLDVQSRRNEDKNVVIPAQSAVPTVTPTGAPLRQHGFAPQSPDDSSNAILLHPEDHIYRTPKAIHLSWNITLEHRSPDGVSKPVYLINGMMVSCQTVKL